MPDSGTIDTSSYKEAADANPFESGAEGEFIGAAMTMIARMALNGTRN
jgi:hypothetical protein